MTTKVTAAATTGTWDTTHKPIVVAVDGSERNRSAVAWAAHEAAALGGALTLLTVVPEHVAPTRHQPGRTREQEALDMLADLRSEVRDIVAEKSVGTAVAAGDPVEVLLDQAHDAGLMVVGKRGLGGFARVMVGSTSIALSGRSPVPVAIVPDGWDSTRYDGRPVVLGVDLDRSDTQAIRLAFLRARRLGVPLVAVHGWETPAMYSWDAAAVTDAMTELEEQTARAFDALLATWAEQYPEVVVRPMRAHQHPAAAILDAAQEAQLVVLGRHPAGIFGGFAFGSVARAVLHYAETPVLTVPVDDEATAS
jgi:nucleotide-binding universal stress UspA family protein